MRPHIVIPGMVLTLDTLRLPSLKVQDTFKYINGIVNRNTDDSIWCGQFCSSGFHP